MGVDPALPGVKPVAGAWLTVDEAYAGQMAERRALIAQQRDDVIALDPSARSAAEELLDLVRAELPNLGFSGTDPVVCPDGAQIGIDRDDPLATLGRLVQSDFCLLDKQGDAHVLVGAVLCFPASWRLDEKFMRPLDLIHDPVPEYTPDLARRVQRLFDGVQVDRPLWRFNRLWYDDPALYQPRSAVAPRRVGPDDPTQGFCRSERQTILRLPRTRVVVFAIHTYVLRGDVALPQLG